MKKNVCKRKGLRLLVLLQYSLLGCGTPGTAMLSGQQPGDWFCLGSQATGSKSTWIYRVQYKPHLV